MSNERINAMQLPKKRESQFFLRYRELKSSLTVNDVKFILHTSVGELELIRFTSFETVDQVVIEGFDIEHKPRRIMFSEHDLESCPLEFKVLDGDKSKGPIGFVGNRQSELVG